MKKNLAFFSQCCVSQNIKSVNKTSLDIKKSKFSILLIFFSFSVFRTAVEKLEKEKYEEIIPLCTQEINITPPTKYHCLALLLRGTMFHLMSQSDEALADFNAVLKQENLDKKVSCSWDMTFALFF